MVRRICLFLVRLRPLLLVFPLLAACSQEQAQVADTSWQITDVYVGNYPSTIDDSAPGAVTMNFGGSSLTGFTGCAPFRAEVRFTNEDKLAVPEDATAMTVSKPKFSPIDEAQCQGRSRFVHEAIVTQLVHGQFTITHPEEDSLVLKESGSDVLDPPGMKLVRY